MQLYITDSYPEVVARAQSGSVLTVRQHLYLRMITLTRNVMSGRCELNRGRAVHVHFLASKLVHFTAEDTLRCVLHKIC